MPASTLHAVERILADARAVTQLTAGGRGLIRGPSPFFAVRPVRQLRRLLELAAERIAIPEQAGGYGTVSAASSSALPRLNSLSAKLGKARDLFQAKQFVAVHADMAHDPLVGHPRAGQLGDDLAHQFDVVRASRPVVTDGRGHAVRKVLFDNGDGQQAPFAFVDALRGEHQIAVVAVHQLVKVLFGVVIADARHRIGAAYFDTWQWFNLSNTELNENRQTPRIAKVKPLPCIKVRST